MSKAEVKELLDGIDEISFDFVELDDDSNSEFIGELNDMEDELYDIGPFATYIVDNLGQLITE
ncbi:hypothetical protein PBI_PBS1_5 [Bacillus phage PBS1]|uniref:Uncharacterized protein n=1 Tax=Bacillus phage PBS1 TaxID=2884423 RepID=A0A223LCX2_BPPB1|nr:hypothetical protein FK780_gp005 [Bacillus phage PBS1]AST99827.1 hypothetical protein PBI_PBS1_5 [Bacillus phage PBS1]BDE75353.1 hypothetical protein [Bacillus phage PBS1]